MARSGQMAEAAVEAEAVVEAAEVQDGPGVILMVLEEVLLVVALVAHHLLLRLRGREGSPHPPLMTRPHRPTSPRRRRKRRGQSRKQTLSSLTPSLTLASSGDGSKSNGAPFARRLVVTLGAFDSYFRLRIPLCPWTIS